MKKRPRTVHARRWTFAIPPNALEFKGSQRDLDAAVALLGPFECVTDALAVQAGSVKRWLDTQLPLSKECARRQVLGLAEILLKELYLSSNAPRAKHVYSELRQLQRAAKDLVRGLRSLNDVTRLQLETARASSSASGSPLSLGVEAVLIKGALPQPSDVWGEHRDGTFVDLLEAIAVLCERGRKQPNSNGGAAEPVDKGGNTNFWNKNAGHPNRNFVVLAYDMFEFFKPGVATSTPNSPFYRFVKFSYQFATGKDHEEDIKALNLLSTIVGRKRAEERLRQDCREVGAQLDALPPGDPAFGLLIERERNLLRQSAEIDPKLYPQYARRHATNHVKK